MNLLGYDYYRDVPSSSGGLARVAHLIREQRPSNGNCLLFDNGDMLQGTPLGDHVADIRGANLSATHPAIAVMNQLCYDAATLGNHDFGFGGGFLLTALKDATFPIVASNLNANKKSILSQNAILMRQIIDRQGQYHILRLGIAGFLPPQTLEWNSTLRASFDIEDILVSAQRMARQLRSEGADIVIALAHSGLGAPESQPGLENAAIPLAAIEGIDLIIAGHVHRRFPSADYPASDFVDPVRGTLNGKPAMMPGLCASDLGVMDLTLRQRDGIWRIDDFVTRLLPATDQTPPDPEISALLAPSHQSTRSFLARPVGQTEVALNSHFSLLGFDAGINLINAAQSWHLRQLLASSEYSHIPVISATAPSRAGGRGGPDQFTDIPAGPLTMRSLADLLPFTNRLRAILVTGAELAHWLEIAACIFRQIVPGKLGQPLRNLDFPSYNFDVISDLSWQIDLSQPALCDSPGNIPYRVRNLRHRNRPVLADDQFILATTDYRLADCGAFAPVTRNAPRVVESGPACRDVLYRYISETGPVAPARELGFSFLWPDRATAVLDTASRCDPRQIAALDPQIISGPRDSFTRLELRPSGACIEG